MYLFLFLFYANIVISKCKCKIKWREVNEQQQQFIPTKKTYDSGSSQMVENLNRRDGKLCRARSSPSRKFSGDGFFILITNQWSKEKLPIDQSHLLRTPPSREAFKHSGCERRLRISPTVTLYFDVELRSDSLPGTQQNTSEGWTGLSESASSRESRSTCFCLWPVAKNRIFSLFTLLDYNKMLV